METQFFQGAAQIAKTLEKLFTDNDEKLAFILDEGMCVVQVWMLKGILKMLAIEIKQNWSKGIFTGVDDPVINIGVVEKGWAVVQLTVNGVQGHASKPPKESAIGILAHAIAKLVFIYNPKSDLIMVTFWTVENVRLQEDNPSPSRFGASVEYDTMNYVAPYASFLYRMVLGNMWIFSSSVSNIMSQDPTTDAIQRTTTVGKFI